jgi:Spherulation-specific family 4
MIPFYSYPGDDWNTVVQAKLANPTVPVVAIINPPDGPGKAMIRNMTAW